MNRKLVSLVLSLILLLIFTTPALAQGPITNGRFVIGENFTLKAGEKVDGDMVVFGGSANIEPGSEVDGSLAVFGGSVSVGGRVTGDVAAMGGSVSVSGQVNGDVAAFGGSINVAEGATVDGDLVSFGGQSNIAEGANVQGRIKDGVHIEGNGDKGFVPPSPPSPPSPPTFNFDGNDGRSSVFSWIGRIIADIVWTIALLITLGLIAWLVAAFMPEQMMAVRTTLTESTAVSFGVGLITMLVSIVVGIVLLITICLAFVPILAWIFLAIASLFGWIVIGQILGERLLVASGRSDPGFIFSSVVGVIILTLLTNMPVVGEIPCIGWVLGFVGAVVGMMLSLAGIGAVLLTRFGFRPYPGPSYGHTGGGRGPRSVGPVGSRVRWTGPEPAVSEEEPVSSEDELNARIKAALAEADEPSDKPPADKPDDDQAEPDESSPNDQPEPDDNPKTDA